MIVSEGAFPSDDGHSRADCEAVHKLASCIGDPFGEARGSGVVFGSQVEAPASSIGDPVGKARGSGVVFVPQGRLDALGTTGGNRTGAEARHQRPGTRCRCDSRRDSGAEMLLDVV